jgi:hypothetical protein
MHYFKLNVMVCLEIVFAFCFLEDSTITVFYIQQFKKGWKIFRDISTLTVGFSPSCILYYLSHWRRRSLRQSTVCSRPHITVQLAGII